MSINLAPVSLDVIFPPLSDVSESFVVPVIATVEREAELRPWETEAKVLREVNGKPRWVTRQSDGKTFTSVGHITEDDATAINLAALNIWLGADDSSPMPADVLPCTKGCGCEAVSTVTYERDGNLYRTDVPAVEVVAEVPTDERSYFQKALAPYSEDGMLLNDPTATVTWGVGSHGMRTYEEVEQVWVDGQQMATETLKDFDPIAEMLPCYDMGNAPKVFKAVGNYVAMCQAKGDGKYGICDGKVSYREVALQSRSDADNKAAFLTALLSHQGEAHGTLTALDFCEHGQRNHVQGTNANGQRWEGLLCKRGRSKTACAPIWVND